MPFNQNTFENQKKLQTEMENLRVHASIERVPLRKTIQDLMTYCENHMQDDALIFPIKENPFKEKRSCTIL